jgi:type I restriction enzyme R subunit
VSELRVSEAGTVQFPMVRHAAEIGWESLTQADALSKRGGEAGLSLYDELREALLRLNPGLVTPDNVQEVIDRLDAIPPTMDGNRDLLEWLRGRKTIYDEAEKRHRPVKLIDFARIDANRFHVTWEWTLKPPARKGNRADVMFLINGVPVCIVEHKNPKLGDAIQRGLTQLARYEIETPELLTAPQVFNVTHLLDYWYGVTWNNSRKDAARWKERPDEAYRFAVQAFFERTDFLRMLKDWVLFFVKDDELRKTVLRQHQTRAVDKVIERCADPRRKRGLIWHTQGSGKTFTLLTAARKMLGDRARFSGATVLLIVDRTELEGQLRGWVDRLLGEMQGEGIAIHRAGTRAELQELLTSDFRGLIVSMIHKFDDIRKDSRVGGDVYVLVDEAHRSVSRDLGTYLMAALPNATIIGFTGTPIDQTAYGQGTFKIFGTDDAPHGYLDRYSIRESIEDGTTLPIRHMLAPSEITVPAERLDSEFFALAEAEGVSDIEDLNRVLERAVTLRTFLKSDDRIAKVADFVAAHFRENVLPLGLKAFLVAVDREACAKYRQALEQRLPREWVEAIYTANPADLVDRPLVAELQLSPEREKDTRELFAKPDRDPKLLIVTDKLLTGYDAPVLYCMYMDKPMRDHVLLQAIARVNRPYVDAGGVPKKVGLVVDFVGVLRELNKALKFDSADISGVIEDLEVLLAEFQSKMNSEGRQWLDAGADGGSDEKLERLVYGRFMDPEARQAFYDFYRDIEGLWEILSPSKELRDYLDSYGRLADLYAILRNAYEGSKDLAADLAHKTRRLVEQNAEQHGLGRLTKTVTFDAKTLEALRGKGGDEPGKVMNLVRGLSEEAENFQAQAPYLIPLKERAERIAQDLQSRNTTGLAAMDALAALAAEKEDAEKSRGETGLSPRAFAVFWELRTDETLRKAGIDPLAVSREVESLAGRFPNLAVNADELRQFRAALYKPLLKLNAEARTHIVERIIKLFCA